MEVNSEITSAQYILCKFIIFFNVILKIDKSVILQYFQQFYEACTYKLEDLQLTITLLSQVIHYKKIKIKSFSKAHKNTF